VERIGAEDDFFALGGPSLLAAQVVARLREDLGIDLPLTGAVRGADRRPVGVGRRGAAGGGGRRGAVGRGAPGGRRPLAPDGDLMTPETETKAGAETETAAAEPRARLSPEQQRALIERRRRRAASPATEAIPPRPRDGGPIPLSLAQGRLWFLERLHPGSPVYNLPVAIRLEGRLDTAALERALGELVRRHEALRTVFAEVDGRPVQVVQEAGGFSLPTARVRPTKAGKETEDQDASVRLLAQKEARRPFDLAAGPLVRGVLLRLAPRHHVLLLTMHHLVFDGWSRGIFFRELDALYAAFAEDGSATPVPEPPLQYGDFAVWQRGHLDGPALDGQIAWWRDAWLAPSPCRSSPTGPTRRGGRTAGHASRSACRGRWSTRSPPSAGPKGRPSS
jgi:hypothetical protein